MEPFIETFTGRRFQPLDPQVYDIRIEDIAHALSNQCRFSGHTRRHYSVAEHSLRVSWLVEGKRRPIEEQLWALLHDASEAYLVDLPTPLKADPTIGSPYRAAEARLMRVICDAFHLPHEMPASVHVADAVMLATEVRDLMANRPEHWDEKLLPAPDAAEITPIAGRWSQSDAEELFLFRYWSLTR